MITLILSPRPNWRQVLRVYLKTPNAPGQRAFLRCAASFFLEIRQYSCEKMSCATQKSLAAGHIMSFQIHPRQYSKYLSRSDFPFQELLAYKYSNRKVDLFFLWDRYFPRNKRSIICIIATFLKISMQHNLYLRRILPCRFVHFAAGGYSHRKVRSAWSCTALKQSAQVLFPVFLACAAKLPILPAALSCIWRVIKYRLPELLRQAV